MDKHKAHIRKAAKEIVNTRSIKDTTRGADINISDILSEPVFSHDSNTGKHDRVYPGNDRFSPGDRQMKDKQGDKGSGGSNSLDIFEDPFIFTLTKKELTDLIFEDLELPNLTRKMLEGSNEYKYRRAGYTVAGNPTNINIKKTFEQSIARRISTKDKEKKPPFLDDIDIRYNNKIQVKNPAHKAVMIAVMDVSGSMDEERKERAKRFYLLLYLFLEKCYSNVEIVFIRHHSVAYECSEYEFFNMRDTGGTIVSPAMKLVSDVIDRYRGKNINFYVAQCSDGDNYGYDAAETISIISGKILPRVQHFAYLQVADNIYNMGEDLYQTYVDYLKYENMVTKKAFTNADIYPVFRELFERQR